MKAIVYTKYGPPDVLQFKEVEKHYSPVPFLRPLQLPIDKLLPSYNIANDRVKNIYNALTSDKIQDQSFWQQFKESATRRNKAVHESKIATRGEGEASFDAARRLVEYLK